MSRMEGEGVSEDREREREGVSGAREPSIFANLGDDIRTLQGGGGGGHIPPALHSSFSPPSRTRINHPNPSYPILSYPNPSQPLLSHPIRCPGFYTEMLWIPALVGAMVFGSQIYTSLYTGSLDNPWVPLYCIFTALWGTCGGGVEG